MAFKNQDVEKNFISLNPNIKFIPNKENIGKF